MRHDIPDRTGSRGHWDALPDTVDLTDAGNGNAVTAQFVKLDRALAQSEIRGRWWTLDVPKKTRENENDYHWEWDKQLGELRNDRWHEAVALRTEDGRVQGALLYWLNGRSFVDQNAGAVVVGALATAPWNRDWLVQPARFRGVGESLLLRAAAHSYLLGLDGRLALEAFDDPRTLGFYTRRGFTIVGTVDGVPQLELDGPTARNWLQAAGWLP